MRLFYKCQSLKVAWAILENWENGPVGRLILKFLFWFDSFAKVFAIFSSRARKSRDVSSPGSEKSERRAAWSCGSRRSGKRSSAVGSVRASRPSQSKSVARCFLLLRVFLTGLSADMIKDACKGLQRLRRAKKATRATENTRR